MRIVSMGSKVMRSVLTCVVAATVLLLTAYVHAAGEQVYVIAESVSTGMEARRILSRQRWTAVPLRRAQFALVVVRSELEMPLMGVYSSVGELKQDAEMQLNISGSNYVVYIFALDDDLRPTELKRIAYPAND
jgi:hypothetical protein